VHCEKVGSILDYDNREKNRSFRQNSGSFLDSQDIPKLF
jgi:hypothetical protein